MRWLHLVVKEDNGEYSSTWVAAFPLEGCHDVWGPIKFFAEYLIRNWWEITKRDG